VICALACCRVENRKTGGGVHVTGFRPGQEFKWNILYEFYTLPGSK
jgi:hypothetical protein